MLLLFAASVPDMSASNSLIEPTVIATWMCLACGTPSGQRSQAPHPIAVARQAQGKHRGYVLWGLPLQDPGHVRSEVEPTLEFRDATLRAVDLRFEDMVQVRPDGAAHPLPLLDRELLVVATLRCSGEYGIKNKTSIYIRSQQNVVIVGRQRKKRRGDKMLEIKFCVIPSKVEAKRSLFGADTVLVVE